MGAGDGETNRGLRLTLREGDVVVHPAGTSHSNISDEGDYSYLAFFPDGSPHWRSENGAEPLDLRAVREETLAVPMPIDPVEGREGWLPGLWREARERYTAVEKGVAKL